MNLKDLVGFWNGTTTSAKYAFVQYTEIDIFESREAGGNHLYLRYRNPEYEIFPEIKLQWQGSGAFICSLPHHIMAEGYSLRGHFTAHEQALCLSFEDSIFENENYQVELKRNNPECTKYRRAAKSLDYMYRVPIAQGKTDYFQPDDASSHGLNPRDLTAMVKKLLKLNSGAKNDAQVDGVLILKDQKLVLEEYFWGLGADDYHPISSCTKSVLSLLFGIAWDKGLIDLDEPVTEIFPEINSDWGKGSPIRLRHILSMTSGTKNGLGDNGLDEKLLRSQDMAKLILGVTRIGQPGATYDYDNKLPFCAGLILERKIGDSLEDFAQKHLFNHLSIKEPRWLHMEQQKSIDGRPFPFTSGAMMLPLREFAKLGQLVLNHGAYDGKQVVSEAWLDLSTSQHTIKGQWPYGFYWHLSTEDQRHLDGLDGILAIGQGEQICAIVPSLNMVIVWMSSTWVNNFGYRVGMKTINEEFISKLQKE